MLMSPDGKDDMMLLDEETKSPVDVDLRQSETSMMPAPRKKKVVHQNDKTIPHMTNLNEDPLMSGVVYYSLVKGTIHIGRKTGTPTPEIILGAIGIK